MAIPYSSSSSSSSDSDSSTDDELFLLSSDEELFVNWEYNRTKPKKKNFFEDMVPQFNEHEFLEHFRVSRGVAKGLSERFCNSEYFHYQSGGNGKLESASQIAIYLWFVGHQTASFREVAEKFSIAISTLFVIIRRITYFLSNISPLVITWPSDEEKLEIEEHFRLNKFPGAIGAIGVSHIKIGKPTNDPDSYLNSKHYFSIKLQVVCDHRQKIRDILVGYPGSVHDSDVFHNSPLANNLAEKCGRYYILGDSGYPCLSNLLTPYKILGQLTRRQQNFNSKLSSNRYIIDRCFSILKQKFRQLHHLKLRNIPDMTHFIRACCVLHNLALDDNFLVENENDSILSHEIDVFGNENAMDDEEAERDDSDELEIRNLIADILPM